MISFSILILSSVSIFCVDSVVIPQDWCHYVKPNGTYKGLRIYRRFLNKKGEADYVMFNRAGDEWLFNVTHIESDEYGIRLLDNTVKHIESNKGTVYRFGIYCKQEGRLSDSFTYLDCTVRQRVKISNILFL